MQDAVDRIIEQWQRERPDLDTSSIAVIGRLSRISQLLDRSMADTFAGHGLQPGWYDVLASLRRAGGDCELTPSALVDTMMLTSGAVTKRIDRLEQLGYVARRQDPADGRGVLVRLTRAGARVLDAASDDHLANQRRLLAGLAERQQDDLVRLLRTWSLALERDEPDA